MKTTIRTIVIAIFVVLALNTTVLAQFYHVSEELTEHNIVHFDPVEGLKSDNPLIRFDSAFILGEIKEYSADIALMKALREDEDESVRIVAALSLIKMESPVGVHLVKRIAELSDCPRTCKILNKFYNSYTKHKTFPNKDLSNYQIASMIYEQLY